MFLLAEEDAGPGITSLTKARGIRVGKDRVRGVRLKGAPEAFGLGDGHHVRVSSSPCMPLRKGQLSRASLPRGGCQCWVGSGSPSAARRW